MENLYDYTELSLSENDELNMILEKVLNNEKLTTLESIRVGRDKVFTEIGDYKLKTYCAYRVIDEETLLNYEHTGFVISPKENDEYIPGKNNDGINWYLGGACPKYGNILIECPAYKEYFQLVSSNSHMADNPYVKHLKSSGFKNPIPFNLVKIISYDIRCDLETSKSR